MQASKWAKGIQWILLMATGALAATVPIAQEPPPPSPHGGMMMGGPGPMGIEAVDGKTIKGSPLTAVFVTIRETTLADGNRIHNETQSKVYRDREGRMGRGVDWKSVVKG